MDAEYFRFLFNYNYWARDRLLAATGGMSEADYASPNSSNYGSLRAILTHLLMGESIWLRRWTGAEAGEGISEESLPDLTSLTARWREEEAKMQTFLGSLTDIDLANDVVLRRPSGETSLPLWKLMAHMANHSTQHRSEAAEILTVMNRSPGDLDLMVFMTEAS